MVWRRRVLIGISGVLLFGIVVMAAWALAIGPDAVWGVLRHGTTTVWDHTEYPGRSITPAAEPQVWDVRSVDGLAFLGIEVDDRVMPLNEVLAGHDTLSFVVVRDGSIEFEWYSADHEPGEPTMLFSVSKAITSLLVGAAVQDGLIDSVADPVAVYVPELAASRLGAVTIEDLLQMDSDLAYVEDDNPFGIHVEFNYTTDLEDDILGLRVRDEPDEMFRYKSGDNALLGLILDRALIGTSVTEYLEERLLHPMGSEHEGMWSTDRPDGLERTWCCLALTARDLARFGQLVLNEGAWNGESIVSAAYIDASRTPAYGDDRWPSEYQDSLLTNYGYQWWMIGDQAMVALGKDGQYLYVNLERDVVIVRLGESQGGIGWVDILHQVATAEADRS